MAIQISIVIPNYNGQKFLKSCLMSVTDQLTDACEIILVDDGSTDGSINIVRGEFSNLLKTGQLKLICIENSGPGEARNIGIRYATGAYIAFVDSDDFVTPDYVSSVVDILTTHVPDILQFNVQRVSNAEASERILIPCHFSANGQYRMADVRSEIFGIGKWFPCPRVFKREIAQRYPFPSERTFYEDLAAIPYIFLEDFSIYLFDRPLYVYRENPNGTTSNHKPEHAYTLCALLKRISAAPHSLARDLLRIQITRSIVFFTLELRLHDIQLGDLRRQIRELQNKSALAAHLGGADRFFLRFPLLYSMLDRGRKWF